MKTGQRSIGCWSLHPPTPTALQKRSETARNGSSYSLPESCAERHSIFKREVLLRHFQRLRKAQIEISFSMMLNNLVSIFSILMLNTGQTSDNIRGVRSKGVEKGL